MFLIKNKVIYVLFVVHKVKRIHQKESPCSIHGVQLLLDRARTELSETNSFNRSTCYYS